MPKTYVEADVKALLAAALEDQAIEIATTLWRHAHQPSADAGSAFLTACRAGGIDAETLETLLKADAR